MVTHRLVQRRQVVQAGGVVGVVLAQRRAADLQRLAEEGQSGGVVTHRLVQRRQVVQAGGVVRVALAQRVRRISIAWRKRGRAAASSPIARYNPARLFRLVA